MSQRKTMSEKEFLTNFIYEFLGEEPTFSDKYIECSVNSFLDKFHKNYYEVEFEPKISVNAFVNQDLVGLPIVVDNSLPDNVIEFRDGDKVISRCELPQAEPKRLTEL